MVSIPKIGNITIGGALAKAAGIIGLAAVAYDSHSSGRIRASMSEKNFKTGIVTSSYMSTLKHNSLSATENAMKEGVMHVKMDENVTPFFANVGGYIRGFASMLVSNVIPFGLSLGAVLTKGVTSKACGIGLAAYGGIFLVKEFFGIGRSKDF